MRNGILQYIEGLPTLNVSDYLNIPKVISDDVYLTSTRLSIPLWNFCRILDKNFEVKLIPITADDLIDEYCSQSHHFDFDNSDMLFEELKIIKYDDDDDYDEEYEEDEPRGYLDE